MVKVKLEHKRGRFVLHVGDLKLECTIEPRRWRNPLLAAAALVLIPPLFFNRPDVLTLLTTANMYACVAIPVAWQMVGIGRMNFADFHLHWGIYGRIAKHTLRFGTFTVLTARHHHGPYIRFNTEPADYRRKGIILLDHHAGIAAGIYAVDLCLLQDFWR